MIGSTVPERDEHPLDDLPALLSGELPPARDAQVGEHLAGCDTCRRELAVVARVSSWLQDAARLPFAEPVELPPLRTPRARRRTRSRRWAGRGRPLAAAAAAAAVLAGGAAGLVALLDRGGGEQVTATVALRPLPPVAASGTATMEGHGAGQRMVVDVHGLPAPPGRAFYEVWLLDPASGRMVAVGVLPPDGHGSFNVPAQVAGGYQAVDVSLEPDDGNPAHSKDSVLRGSIS